MIKAEGQELDLQSLRLGVEVDARGALSTRGKSTEQALFK